MKYPYKNILIVDDEAPARRKIINFLKKYGADQNLLEASSGSEAIDYIENESIDLMFLDIHMPGMSGLDMLGILGADKMPKTIFSTAYDQYAIQAFDLQAVDYLLKPFDYERFVQALDKSLKSAPTNRVDQIELLQKLFAANKSGKDRIWVSHGGKYVPVFFEAIEYLESDGNYVQIISDGKKYLLRKTLGQIQAELPEGQFVKTQKSYVVNSHRIASIKPKSHGDCIITMESGAEIPLSRNHRSKLL